MENLSLAASLFIAGLIIGLLISFAVSSILCAICEAIYSGSANRRLGTVMLMLYVPTLAFLIRDMTEVTPMIVGVLISSFIISAIYIIKNLKSSPV